MDGLALVYKVNFVKGEAPMLHHHILYRSLCIEFGIIIYNLGRVYVTSNITLTKL